MKDVKAIRESFNLQYDEFLHRLPDDDPLCESNNVKNLCEMFYFYGCGHMRKRDIKEIKGWHGEA